MEKQVKYGLIGLGNMGSVYLDYFTGGEVKGGRITAIADLVPARLAAAKAKLNGYGEVKCCLSGDELIDRADVDAVIIATPHYSHPPLGIRALGKNIHVLCEKPAGVYGAQVSALNRAAKKSKALFTVMFNQRTNPLYKKMRELVQSGELGEVKRLNFMATAWYRLQSYYDSGDWRATWAGEGGGVLINQAVHQIDLIGFVSGLKPVKVNAHCHFGKWHDIETEDDVSAYLEFEGGATGVFVTSTADTPGTNRFEVLLSKGKLVCEDGLLTVIRLETDERQFNREYKGGFGEPDYKAETITYQTGDYVRHPGVINNFTQAILGREKLLVDGKEGIYGVQLINAMLLSAWDKRTVTCPVDENYFLSRLSGFCESSRLKEIENKILDNRDSFGDKR